LLWHISHYNMNFYDNNFISVIKPWRIINNSFSMHKGWQIYDIFDSE
jgi:hypothetical protein